MVFRERGLNAAHLACDRHILSEFSGGCTVGAMQVAPRSGPTF